MTHRFRNGVGAGLLCGGAALLASVGAGADVDAVGTSSLAVLAGFEQLGADIDGEAAEDLSGWSVSMSADGNRVAIGAAWNDGNGNSSGHVRIYDWNGSTWIQAGTDIDGEATDDRSGGSVSMSADGNRVAIGAAWNDGNGNSSGHVRIYDWNGSTWIQAGTDIDGEATDDRSGGSVSMSADGNRVAIGAPGNDGNRNSSGHVRIYDWNGSTWIQAGTDIDGEAAGDESGWSVSMSADGTRVAIGAAGNVGNGNSSGHVRVYDWNGSTWIQAGTDIDGEAAEDLSGWSVSMSADGTRVAIGAPGNDGNGNSSGHVRIYDWNGSTWIQAGTDIDGEAGDQSGWSVSMSADGTRVAIGAPGNDGNGVDSGHVRVYDWNGSTWIQAGTDIDGEATDDESGRSVSMSADGNRVAIGARGNDGNGINSGHVRVYAVVSTDPASTTTTTTSATTVAPSTTMTTMPAVPATTTGGNTLPATGSGTLGVLLAAAACAVGLALAVAARRRSI